MLLFENNFRAQHVVLPLQHFHPRGGNFFSIGINALFAEAMPKAQSLRIRAVPVVAPRVSLAVVVWTQGRRHRSPHAITTVKFLARLYLVSSAPSTTVILKKLKLLAGMNLQTCSIAAVEAPATDCIPSVSDRRPITPENNGET